jgi:hypothetical protein
MVRNIPHALYSRHAARSRRLWYDCCSSEAPACLCARLMGIALCGERWRQWPTPQTRRYIHTKHIHYATSSCQEDIGKLFKVKKRDIWYTDLSPLS